MKPESTPLSTDLIDTQWYALTIDDPLFAEIIHLRKDQGFDAIQLVVGYPPEIGPEHPRARTSDENFPWTQQNEPNLDYLEFARQRIQQINELGMTAYIYGAWGHQIDWYGKDGVELMKNWWEAIVSTVDDLDVVYSVTGEANLWINGPDRVLPDLTLGDTLPGRLRPHLHPNLLYWRRQLMNKFLPPDQSLVDERYAKWNEVLKHISTLTERHILIHTHPGITSHDVAHEDNWHLLAAETWQTGHKYQTRPLLHRLPLQAQENHPGLPSINLEVWYDGLDNRFWVEDQLYAYLASVMAGAHSHAYGAQGVWNGNIGDSHLDHWGPQTMQQAMKLDTPKLLGSIHAFFDKHNLTELETVKFEENRRGHLKYIARSGTGGSVTYYPDISKVKTPELTTGDIIFPPLEGKETNNPPSTGPVVIFSQPTATP